MRIYLWKILIGTFLRNIFYYVIELLGHKCTFLKGIFDIFMTFKSSLNYSNSIIISRLYYRAVSYSKLSSLLNRRDIVKIIFVTIRQTAQFPINYNWLSWPTTNCDRVLNSLTFTIYIKRQNGVHLLRPFFRISLGDFDFGDKLSGYRFTKLFTECDQITVRCFVRIEN